VNTYIEKVSVNDRVITQNGTIHNINSDSVVVRIWFSSKIEKEKYDPLKIFVSNGVNADISILSDTLSRVFSFRINKKLDKFYLIPFMPPKANILALNLSTLISLRLLPNSIQLTNFPLLPTTVYSH